MKRRNFFQDVARTTILASVVCRCSRTQGLWNMTNHGPKRAAIIDLDVTSQPTTNFVNDAIIQFGLVRDIWTWQSCLGFVISSFSIIRTELLKFWNAVQQYGVVKSWIYWTRIERTNYSLAALAPLISADQPESTVGSVRRYIKCSRRIGDAEM